MRVLVVDDDRLQRLILRRSLAEDGYEVVEAGDGGSAWEWLQTDPVRLVITDWMMPGMDGPELIRRIRTADRPGYTYIILLTARGETADVIRGLESGADDYLSKPFDRRELRARVAIGGRVLDLEQRLSEARDQLEVLAMFDGLTELHNRRAMQEFAEAELHRSARAGLPVSFILLDIDHFKSVNDRHGHLIGDLALRSIADTLRRCTRPYDRLARWGGEEFLVMLPASGLTEAAAVAERLRRAVEATPLALPAGGQLRLTISLGVAVPAPGVTDLDAALQRTDEALYAAKRAGRNRVSVSECGAVRPYVAAPRPRAERVGTSA